MNKPLLFTVGLLALSACSSDPDSTRPTGTTLPDNPAGRALYASPIEGGNTFACATCHALREPADDGFRRPGHAIGDAYRRTSWKNGKAATLRDAVNTCLTEWMNMSAPWTAADERWLALEAYLESQAPGGAAPSVQIQVVAPPAVLTGGDADRGRTMFNTSCMLCHGMNALGTQRAPALSGIRLDADYIARRVRTSGMESSPIYDGLTGGRMPFWGADRLSDAELLDVIAFVTSLAPTASPDAGTTVADSGANPTPDAGVPAVDGGQSSTHPKVGQTAVLRTRFHQVSGTARIIDDRTITIEMFNFDGGGIDVRAYGALNGNYRGGFSMSPDLVRRGGYSNETLTLTLPANRTLDDLDGISIWCVPVGASFGDGMFQ